MSEHVNTMRSRDNGQFFIDNLRWMLRACGVTEPSAIDKLLAAAHPNGHPSYVWEAPYISHNTTLQMCIPQLEFPISDRPPSVRFGGTLPARAFPTNAVLPDWMDEIRANGKPGEKAGRKKVIFVAQGTVDYDHRNLVVPTIEAFKDDDSVLVVAVLCFKGASLSKYYQLPEQTNGESQSIVFKYQDQNKGSTASMKTDAPKAPLPSNARVAAYLPFDVVLPYADVFVSRTGYGGLQHAVSNGVPMVQGGAGVDKPDIALRVEYAGLGLWLQGHAPRSPEDVRGLVQKVLGDGNFRARAQELKAEAEKFGALDTIDRELRALWE